MFEEGKLTRKGMTPRFWIMFGTCVADDNLAQTAYTALKLLEL